MEQIPLLPSKRTDRIIFMEPLPARKLVCKFRRNEMIDGVVIRERNAVAVERFLCIVHR